MYFCSCLHLKPHLNLFRVRWLMKLESLPKRSVGITSHIPTTAYPNPLFVLYLACFSCSVIYYDLILSPFSFFCLHLLCSTFSSHSLFNFSLSILVSCLRCLIFVYYIFCTFHSYHFLQSSFIRISSSSSISITSCCLLIIYSCFVCN